MHSVVHIFRPTGQSCDYILQSSALFYIFCADPRRVCYNYISVLLDIHLQTRSI